MSNLRLKMAHFHRGVLIAFGLTTFAIAAGVSGLSAQSGQTMQVTRAAGSSCESVSMDSVSDVNGLASALQNRIAGLQISTRMGHAGAGTGTRLRGNGSASGSNEPLIVVDDIPIRSIRTSTVTRSFTAQSLMSALDFIDPTDIGRVEILRGPAATILYGMDAADGVIRVYTKRGVQKGGNRTGTNVRCPS